MPNLLDDSVLGQSMQAAKEYADKRIDSLGDIAVLIKGDKGDKGDPGASVNIDQVIQDLKNYIDDKFNELNAKIEEYHPPISYVIFASDEERMITPVYTNDGVTLQYSLDTTTWTNIASGTATPSAKTIYMRGQATGTKSLYINNQWGNGWKFSGDATNKLRVTGNLNYLLCDTLGDSIAPTALADYCYYQMFRNCTSLIKAPELPATTLADSCYYGMFWSCDSLISVPELPATTLAGHCYECMFLQCISLINAPALPAITLVNDCYNCMFEGCVSLIKAPALPATTLAECCYECMFLWCESLITAPDLPATTLVKWCYNCMFSACYSLVNVPALPATTLVEGCYGWMFRQCYSLINAPELPATTLAYYCYNQMFWECISLKSLKIHTTINLTEDSALTSMLSNVSSSGTLTCKSELTEALLPTPAGWTRVNF